MNLPTEIHGLLFGFITLNLLAWPFYPAWREWRRPSDATAYTWPTEPALTSKPVQIREGLRKPAPKDRRQMVLARMPNAQAWGERGLRIEGDCQMPAGSYWPGSLVVHGDLFCGADSVVEGDVKVHGHVHLAQDSALRGAVFASSVFVGHEATVQGPVVAHKRVQLDSGASIGSPDCPTSVSAARLDISDTAHVYGMVWTPDQRASA